MTTFEFYPQPKGHTHLLFQFMDTIKVSEGELDDLIQRVLCNGKDECSSEVPTWLLDRIRKLPLEIIKYLKEKK